MADKHYVDEIGTLLLVDCGTSILGATVTKLNVVKPEGASPREVEWDATISGTNYLQYTTVSGNFSQAGKYYLQSFLTLPSWTGLGETTSFVIYESYK